MNEPFTIHQRDPFPDTSVPDPHQDTFSKNVLGFWVYLMTDCLVFASLFVTYAVLHSSTFGGPSSKDLFHLPTALFETATLLLSTVSCGLALLSAKNSDKTKTLIWLAVTMLLGTTFLFTEFSEFNHLVQSGNSWQRSAFLSSFFTLVGTHGLHISIGLLWMLVIAAQVSLWGITVHTFRRLIIFGLFWHFLDLVWIFIFTFVYLMGVL